MRKFLTILSVLFVISSQASLFGITIDDAVKLSLSNSFSIQEKEYDRSSLGYSKLKAFGSFTPQVNLKYTSDISTPKPERLNTVLLQASLRLSLIQLIGIDSANKIYSNSLNTIEIEKKAVAQQTRIAYVNILRAEKAVELANSSVNFAESSYNKTEQLFNAGILIKSQLLQSATALSKAVQQEVSAKNALEISTYNLYFILNTDIPKNVSFEEIFFDYSELANYSTLEETMFQNNKEYKAVLNAYEISSSLKNINLAAFTPSVTLAYINSDSSTEVIPNFEDFDESGSTTLSVDWAPFNSFSTYSEYKQSGINKKKAKLRTLQTQRQLTIQLKNLEYSYLSSPINIKAAKSAVLDAETSYNSQKELYDTGTITFNDLEQSKLAYLSALSAYYSTVYNSILVKFELEDLIESKI